MNFYGFSDDKFLLSFAIPYQKRKRNTNTKASPGSSLLSVSALTRKVLQLFIVYPSQSIHSITSAAFPQEVWRTKQKLQRTTGYYTTKGLKTMLSLKGIVPRDYPHQIWYLPVDRIKVFTYTYRRPFELFLSFFPLLFEKWPLPVQHLSVRKLMLHHFVELNTFNFYLFSCKFFLC